MTDQKPDAEALQSDHPDFKNVMIRAIRQEILELNGSQAAAQARLSHPTIEKIDRRAWVAEGSCRKYLGAVNKGLADRYKAGQLELPLFEDLELRDLFEAGFNKNRMLWRAIPGPGADQPRKKMVKAFLREKIGGKAS